MEKVTKNDLAIISKPHAPQAHPHTMKKTCKISKGSAQNCKRSCAHKTPQVNIDRQTDGQRETCTPKSSVLKQCDKKGHNSHFFFFFFFPKVNKVIYFPSPSKLTRSQGPSSNSYQDILLTSVMKEWMDRRTS